MLLVCIASDVGFVGGWECCVVVCCVNGYVVVCCGVMWCGDVW